MGNYLPWMPFPPHGMDTTTPNCLPWKLFPKTFLSLYLAMQPVMSVTAPGKYAPSSLRRWHSFRSWLQISAIKLFVCGCDEREVSYLLCQMGAVSYHYLEVAPLFVSLPSAAFWNVVVTLDTSCLALKGETNSSRGDGLFFPSPFSFPFRQHCELPFFGRLQHSRRKI